MTKLNNALIEYLKNTFQDRVTFDDVERMLYSHDIAAMPSLIKPLMGNTIPDAVVQPVSEGELQTLASWAAGNGIPLTPRGKASSGYGGVLPVEQGIVVDFYRLKKILSMDKEKLIATVQPGIVWERLDHELKKQGLTLLTYPSSYPGSTVGGWLAQGGAGFGSYEAGWFRDTVVSARVVLPDGAVQVFEGKDLDMISEAEGITGLISEITIRVQSDEAMDLVSIGCSNAHDLQKMMEAMHKENLPIWSLVFINPRMAEMKNQAPLMEHMGHPAEERVLLPASYITTLTFRAKDREKVIDGLHSGGQAPRTQPCARRGGHTAFLFRRLHDQGGEDHPAAGRQGRRDDPEFALRKAGGGDPRIHSRRRAGLQLQLRLRGLSLSMMRLAEKHGGRAYATGLYFSTKARDVLGKDRLARLTTFKKQVDPKGILNPGKVLGGKLIGMAVMLGSLFEPLIRPFGNAVFTKVGERPTTDSRDIPADVAWYAHSCSQCGYCVDECDQFYGRGWESQSPRGKWYWLREYMKGKQEWSQKV
ncbi:MAG: FAD-binding protein, partial [Deltaproteobacteria bacterium]|nr:FAD-binding protein [Deltaproteobacteria bacterium]